jgi:hypothetical protein
MNPNGMVSMMVLKSHFSSTDTSKGLESINYLFFTLTLTKSYDSAPNAPLKVNTPVRDKLTIEDTTTPEAFLSSSDRIGHRVGF